MFEIAILQSFRGQLVRPICAIAAAIGVASSAACSKPGPAGDAAASAAATSSSAPATAASDAGNGNTAGAAPSVDYGVLGPPSGDGDPDISKRSAKANLVRFRHNERHPVQGTEDQPLDWRTIIELHDTQRALFYAVAQADPSLIDSQDRAWLKADEDTILSLGCENRDDPVPAVQLSAKDCAGAQ